ncbi:MAG: hypothetical protein AAF192_06640, partial [Pseudomonadota bacterium]
RFRDFVGAGHPLGEFRVRRARNVSFGHTFADRDATRTSPEARFLLGRSNDVDVVSVASIEIDAFGDVLLFVSPDTFARFEDLDDYFGVNTASLRFGQRIEPKRLRLFGFIGDSGQRAAGLFPEGPEEGDASRFRLNGCVVGDVQDCTGVTAPSVLEIVRIDEAQILNVEEEDLLELFVSYGNEELWGVPPGYFLDIDVADARAEGNAQLDEEPGVFTAAGGAGAGGPPSGTGSDERIDR